MIRTNSMKDSLSKSLNRFIDTGGKDYTSPAKIERSAKALALRKMGVRKLKVKSIK